MYHKPVVSRRRRLGQTLSLIETLVIVAIIAILAAILIPKYLTVRQQAQVGATESTMKNVGSALEMYYSVNLAYPASTGTVNAALFGGAGNNFYNGTPVSPNGGGSYTYTIPSGGGSGGTASYYVIDSGVYASYLLSSLPKTTGPGSDSSSGNCGTTCTHIEFNPDMGITGST